MEESLVIEPDVIVPGYELWFTASRSGGPGGQHVNKTSSRVTLHWDVKNTSALDAQKKARVLRRLGSRVTAEGVVQIHVEDTRSQHRNKEIARERLVEVVRAALVVPKKRVPTKAGKGAKRRRLAAKTRRAEVKKGRRRPSEND